MKALVQYTLKTFLLLFLMVPIVSAKKEQLTPVTLCIDLEKTVDELLRNAPVPLPDDNPKYSTLKTFILYNVDPHIRYRGKEISFNGASFAFLTYQYDVPVNIRIGEMDTGPKTIKQIKKELRVLLPAIDALGFKREKGNEKFSVENLPFPEKYISKKGSSIGWISNDQLKMLRLIISTPVNPEIYSKEKRYFLSFVYYDETDEKVLEKNWLKKRSGSNNG